MVEPILIIAGPTAVGKSALAIRLAQALGGEIINLDSVQMYRDFIIGAAQPSEQEKQIVPHHLYGAVSPHEKMSVGRYVKLHAPILEALQARKKIPIFCGGTSLYINGIIYGLSDLPEDAQVREEIEALSTEVIYELLLKEDPTSVGAIHRHDRMRLSRALEVMRLGVSITDAHAFHRKRQPKPTIVIIPMLARDTLYARINRRTEEMLERGLLQETAQLLSQYGQEAQGLRSIGYKETVEYLSKKKYGSLPDLSDAISQATRHSPSVK